MNTDNINANDSEIKHGVLNDLEFVEVKTEVPSEDELPNEESFLYKSTVENQCITNLINFKVKTENIEEELEENCLFDTTFEQGCSSRIKDEYIEEKFSYEEYKTPDIKKPKTTTERVRDWRARKRLLRPQKPPAKTGAQRIREYRARKKALKNAAATMGDTEIRLTSFSRLQELHTDNPDTTQPSTSRDDDINKPKTTAECVQDCKARKKLLKQKPPAKTGAQRIREYRARKKALKNAATTETPSTSFSGLQESHTVNLDTTQFSSSRDNDTKRPKTATERVRDFRAREKLLKQKPPAKTGAQRNREYRARKKALKNSAATIIGVTETPSTSFPGFQDSYTVTPDTTQPSTSKDDGNILYNYLSQTSGQPQVLDDNLQERIVLHQANSSQCVINPNIIQITRTKKSCAQRCREYRQRKKARDNINVINDVNAIVPRKSVVSPVDPNQLLQAEAMEVQCDLHLSPGVRRQLTPTDLPQQQFRDEFTNNRFGHVCHITLNDGQIVQDYVTQPISIKEEVHEETCVGDDKKCKTEINEDDAFVGIYIAEPSKEINDDGDVDYKIDIKEMHFMSNEFDENKYTLETKNSDDQRIFATKQPNNVDLVKQENKSELESPSTSDIQTCKICGYCTKYKTLLNMHISSVHNNVKVIIETTIRYCQFCDKLFTSKHSFEKHLLKQHKSLDDHLLNEHKQEIKGDCESLITSIIHKCNICSYTTKNKFDLGRHFNSVHNEQRTKFVCQNCDKSFVTESSLENHLLKQHNQEIKGDLKGLISNKIHKCTICTYKTTKKCNLDRHFDSLHNDQKTKINCQFCDKSFSEHQLLDDHLLKKHKQEIEGDLNNLVTSKIYKCKVCSYQTTYKSALDRHFNSIHNEQSKLNCQFCNKLLLSKKTLNEHLLKQHKQEIKNDFKSLITTRIYKCNMCSYQTTVNFNLQIHIDSKHNEQRSKINCQLCDKSFFSKQSLNEHLLKQHKDKVQSDFKSLITSKIHKCNVCTYETTRIHSLKSHINSNHKNQAKLSKDEQSS